MNKPVSSVVIVGGGTAGWITAGLLAAENKDIEVTLVESPDIPTIGVGEGTWPTMRTTLKSIGISEIDLVRECDASFKQGTQFVDWEREGTAYYHPFMAPVDYPSLPLTDFWLESNTQAPFADFVTPQAQVIAAGLAPKQASMPPYSHVVNYGYHFDAGKFAAMLHRHAVDKLGVTYVSANVERIEGLPDGDIEAVVLDSGDLLRGDLFVDCTGQKALLIGEHFGSDFVSVKDVLFNDRAIAVQVLHESPNAPIASITRATAVSTGWIWDIALRNRRGIGHVFSSAYASDAEAMASIAAYVRAEFPKTPLENLSFRTIPFEPGYREQFWVKNCVAIGLSGGFIEPLEASALALIEQAAMILNRQFPANHDLMRIVAKRFNAKMHYHWQRVIEFLKLHYVLSRRDDSRYWKDSRDLAYCPEELADKLLLWQQRSPWYDDVPHIDELFPAASYQYVLYGMGFRPTHRRVDPAAMQKELKRVDRALHESAENARRMQAQLPTNRQLLDELVSLPGVA